MEEQVNQLKFELIQLCWYMRGSVSIDQAYMMGPEDRKMAYRLIKDNIETVKKTKLPLI